MQFPGFVHFLITDIVYKIEVLESMFIISSYRNNSLDYEVIQESYSLYVIGGVKDSPKQEKAPFGLHITVAIHDIDQNISNRWRYISKAPTDWVNYFHSTNFYNAEQKMETIIPPWNK